MNLLKILNGYSAMQSFTSLSLPFQKARALKQICDTLKGEVDFYLQEEKKLISQFAKKDKDGNPVLDGNKIKFDDVNSANQYLAETTKLNELEIDIEIVPVVLTESEIGNQSVSVKALEQIEEFIIIE